MLNSLYIKNYRNLKELSIDSVAQINLINGENNTGKTSLLEALAIYASNANLEYLFQIIENRGGRFDFFSSIFTDRTANTDEKYSIIIGEKTNSQIKIRFIAYIDEISKGKEGESRKRIIVNENNAKQYPEYKIALMINSDIIPLDDLVHPTLLSYNKFNSFREVEEVSHFEYISTNNIDKEINGKLFDNIALTEQEKSVIEALKIIEPDIEGIAFIDEKEYVKNFINIRNDSSRNAVVKLQGTPTRLPIKSMGDGINRILTIVLALVNSKNGFLLIDEFENGLHYKSQEKLWNIIFKLAKNLNVQIFATTHSNDCIHSFSSVLNNPENQVTGKLIRLENKNGVIQQVEYSPKELEIATKNNIETR
jgi:AAA15 family ATPase/GTPase